MSLYVFLRTVYCLRKYHHKQYYWIKSFRMLEQLFFKKSQNFYKLNLTLISNTTVKILHNCKIRDCIFWEITQTNVACLSFKIKRFDTFVKFSWYNSVDYPYRDTFTVYLSNVSRYGNYHDRPKCDTNSNFSSVCQYVSTPAWKHVSLVPLLRIRIVA